MGKVGYLTKKYAKGKLYIYVRQSYRVNKKVKHRYLFSFGPMPEALIGCIGYLNNKSHFQNDYLNVNLH